VHNRTSSLRKKIKFAAQILSVVAFVYPTGYAMDTASSPPSLHAQITHDALAGSLSDDNLKVIIDANDSQDAAGSDGAKEARRHFDANSINNTVNYINREKNKALTLASEADSEPQARLDALRHFGLMIHAAQDFYLHSNYLEQQLRTEENRNDPYNIALVDWNKFPEKMSAAKYGDPEDALNKDSATAGGGKTAIAPKVTYHSAARDLAVRETQRQWNLFETLVRARCGDRAPRVIAALRQASTPTAAQTATGKDMEPTQTIVGDPTAPAPQPDPTTLRTDDRSPDNPDADQGP